TLIAAIFVALTLTRERHFVPSGGLGASARSMVRHVRDPRLIATFAIGFGAMTDKERRSSAVGLYASIYYVGGSAGAFLGGIAWSLAGWPGCVATIAALLVIIRASV